MPSAPDAPLAAPTCSRRDALASLVAGTLCVACGAATVGPSEADAVTLVGRLIEVRLDRVPSLRSPDSAFVIGEHQVIVLRVGASDYRAFSNVCTHAGCGIHLFIEGRMRCQCHGSEYDVDGHNVAGPAPLPLRRLEATLDNAARLLRIKLDGP